MQRVLIEGQTLIGKPDSFHLSLMAAQDPIFFRDTNDAFDTIEFLERLGGHRTCRSDQVDFDQGSAGTFDDVLACLNSLEFRGYFKDFLNVGGVRRGFWLEDDNHEQKSSKASPSLPRETGSPVASPVRGSMSAIERPGRLFRWPAFWRARLTRHGRRPARRLGRNNRQGLRVRIAPGVHWAAISRSRGSCSDEY